MIPNKLLIAILAIVTTLGCNQTNNNSNKVVIETQFGSIHIQLYPEKAPKTVKAFLSYVDSGYYKNGTFYRVLKKENQAPSGFRSELIQGGIYESNYNLATKIHGIEHESTRETKLSHLDGTISLARTTPGSASTEFFICIGDQPSYDYMGDSNPDKLGYAAFGRVVDGLPIVKKIHSQPENGEDFDPPVKIINIKRE